MIAQVTAILAGAVLGVLLLCLLASGIGWAWGPFYSNEADMARNVKLFLSASVIAAIAGGWFAGWLRARNLTGGIRTSPEREKEFDRSGAEDERAVD